jgi:hypothetical protein
VPGGAGDDEGEDSVAALLGKNRLQPSECVGRRWQWGVFITVGVVWWWCSLLAGAGSQSATSFEKAVFSEALVQFLCKP